MKEDDPLHRRTKDVVAEAERRLWASRLSDDEVASIAKFRADHRLGDEVELGMRMLSPGRVKKVLDNLRDHWQDLPLARRNDFALSLIGKADPSVEALVRQLDKAQDPHGPRRKRHRSSSKARHRSRSRRRERRSPCATRPRRRSNGKHVRERWSRSLSRRARREGSERWAREWVAGLDANGSMMRYLPAMEREFSSITEVRQAMVCRPSGNRSVLSCIEPSVFQSLGVESLGHRLLLAKGIIALNP